MKKSLLFLLFVSFAMGTLAQEDFIGKIAYIKETKNGLNEYVAKSNSSIEVFFNKFSYAFVQTQQLNLEAQAEKLVKTIPTETMTLDSFELVRQKKKILQQLEEQMGAKSTTTAVIEYASHVSKKPRTIGNVSYCVVDTVGYTEWQLKSDTLTIEGLLCQKAVGFFAGKYYDVWFAPSIPFAAGPFNMHGLPGIIVLATSQDEKTRYRMKKVDYPLQQPFSIVSCSGGMVVNNSEFSRLQAQAIEQKRQDAANYKRSRENN